MLRLMQTKKEIRQPGGRAIGMSLTKQIHYIYLGENVNT